MTELIHFKKMHGLGNDFVIIDGRETGVNLTPDQVRFIADRKRGIGCDLVALIKYSKTWQEMPFVHLINADGSEIEACGNAARCIADILMTKEGTDNIVIETLYGSLNCWKEKGGLIRVEMGKPELEWNKIPLAEDVDILNLPLNIKGLDNPATVSMGNPHCIFFVDNIEDKWTDKAVEEVGSALEVHPMFPNKTNVEFVEVLSPKHLRMRIWERGCGITEACGSGACAIVVAAIKRGLTERKVKVTLDGGDLIIDWPNDEAPVSMTGPVAYVFDGQLELL
jgi:diaminopimelate epimerase